VALPEVQVAFAVVERAGRVLAVRRGKGALLAGMWALPGGEVREAEGAEGTLRRTLSHVGLRLADAKEIHRRRKVFSSRVWDARVFRCSIEGRAAPSEHTRWFSAREREKVPFVPFQREILERLEQ
jgi:adenine-specific DNA glycosylase